MVRCSVECVQRVSQYLQVPSGELHISENNIVASNDLIENTTVEGFSTIVQALARNSRFANILGRDAETKALVQQWLEYAVVNVNYADSFANAKRILQELNEILQSSTYIAGTVKTIADIALYYALHPIMQGLTHQEKAHNVNISRWFDNIQQDEKLRQNLELINFDLLHLYL